VSELEPVSALLEDAVRRGDPPAAAACAILDRRVVHESAHGASVDSVFDVASVTKIAATTLAIASLVRGGEVALEAPISRWLPWPGAADATVRELLGHRSGLPAWRTFFVPAIPLVFGDAVAGEGWSRSRELVLEQLYGERTLERGTRLYSDLGFLGLGVIAEIASGQRLDALVRETIHAPLGLDRDLGFVDLAAERTWIAGRHVLATGRTRPREPAPGQDHDYRVPPQPLRDDAGRVDDDNAFAMGGVAGHAGLFGTARAVASLGAAILAELDDAGPLGLGAVLREFAAPDPARGAVRGLGFDRPAAGAASTGAIFGRGARGAIGHLGFTGCSLWIDLDRRLSVALLTNRTLPGRARVEGIRMLRPAFHDTVVRALGS
jgi:CubicO group peptidase (beta-lactamase class C family)